MPSLPHAVLAGLALVAVAAPRPGIAQQETDPLLPTTPASAN